ncbi:AraC family transcriptional regulator [Rapidithrix thailandica]|uniref:AraC family transcriptional regulator n=1 Tax=Rapidithrix thailandica TaxID=413964 RepID=A0AAW9RWX9_9BACT
MDIKLQDYFRATDEHNTLVLNDLIYAEYRSYLGPTQHKLWSEDHFMVFVIQGIKKIITTDQQYTIQPGEGLFLKKGSFVMSEIPDQDDCYKSLLLFTSDQYLCDFFKELQHLFPSDPQNQIIHTSVPFTVDHQLQSLLQAISDISTQAHSSKEKEIAKLRVKELLIHILDVKSNHTLRECLQALTIKNNEVQLKEVMESNFTANIALKDFAQLAGMSLSKFKRHFESFYQTSPGKWLLHKRLQHAQRLLNSTDMNISEIAFHCGFQNLSHFSKVFKQHTGFSPTEFQKEDLL